MTSILLHDKRRAVSVTLPLSFLEKYMPPANGEFVKIYLTLLARTAAGGFSVADCADLLSCTEKDVLRGLRYWEKAGLLTLEWETKDLKGITLLPTEEEQGLQATEKAAEAEFQAPEAAPAVRKAEKKPQLSSSRVRELCSSQNPDIEQITYVAEQYLGRTLSSTDLNRILYFYDELHFSVDLLDYLIEYCVSRGKTSMSYIQKVGLAWQEDHITTVAEARERTSRYRREYYAFLRAYGIRNREPLNSEITYFDKWMREYGFSQEIICAACERTVRQTGKLSLGYTDSILTGWKNEKITTLQDVEESDARFRQERKKTQQTTAGKEKSREGNTSNRFHNFHERDYDYDQLEANLFKKQFPDA